MTNNDRVRVDHEPLGTVQTSVVEEEIETSVVSTIRTICCPGKGGMTEREEKVKLGQSSSRETKSIPSLKMVFFSTFFSPSRHWTGFTPNMCRVWISDCGMCTWRRSGSPYCIGDADSAKGWAQAWPRPQITLWSSAHRRVRTLSVSLSLSQAFLTA